MGIHRLWKTSLFVSFYILLDLASSSKLNLTLAQEINSPKELKRNAIAILTNVKTEDERLKKEIDKIVGYTQNSLEDLLWVDDWHLVTANKDGEGRDWQQGLKVFHEEKKAVKRLLKDIGRKIDENDGYEEDNDEPFLVFGELKTLFEGIINNLVSADRLLSEIALSQAKVYIGVDKEIDYQIEIAEKELEEAKGELENDISDKVIKKYEKAWEHSQLALKHVTPEIAQQAANKWLLQMESAFISEDQEEIFEAVAAIEEIGRYSIAPLIKFIQNETRSSQFRSMLVEVLSNIGDESAVAPLIELLRRNINTQLRDASAIALGVIGSNSSVEPLIESLENDSCQEVRQSAALSLGSIKDERAILPLTNALVDEDNMVRTNALRALGELGATTVIPQIIKKLDDLDPYVRYTAAQTLGKLGNETVMNALLLKLQDEDENVRKNAIEAIIKIVTPQSTAIAPSLIEVINEDIDWNVRQGATNALIKIGQPAVSYLLTAYQSARPIEREHIAYALGKIGDSQAIETLRQTLSSDNKSDALNAAIALYRLGLKDEMYNFALNLLSNEKRGLRESAAIALGEMGDQRAVETLEVALLDSELFVRDAVSLALEKITGRVYEYQH